MFRKALVFLCATVFILLGNASVFAQLDPAADQYLDAEVGYSVDAAKVSGDAYRDLAFTNQWVGSCIYNNTHSATMPYFSRNQNITLAAGYQVRFSSDGSGGVLGIPNNASTAMYLNTNNNALPLNQTLTSSNNKYIEFGMLNNDLYIDMLGFEGGVYNHIHRFYNDGNNNFTQVYPDFVPQGAMINLMKLAKLDTYWSPALPSLIVAGRVNSDYAGLWIYDNNGNGSFNPTPRQYWTFYTPNNLNITDIAVGDVNDDDYPDLVICLPLHIYSYLNDGVYNPGHFYENSLSQPDQPFSHIALINMDYDRYPDLAAVDLDYSVVKVYMNVDNPYYADFSTTPAWTGTMAPYVTDKELMAADITGTGALSLICTGSVAQQPPYWGFWVFKDHADPRVHHPTNFQVIDCGTDHHPLLQWKPNSEDDLAGYRIYRALMEDETPPVDSNFVCIGSVNNDVNQYIDGDVYMTSQYANYKIWYYVTAVDLAAQESLTSSFMRFWGLYRPQSEGPGIIAAGTLQPETFTAKATPNPFNPATALSYQLQATSQVSLKVYDTAGRLVATLVDGWQEAGTHSVTFDGSAVPSGIYFYHLTAGANTAIGKMVLLK